jgi:subtilisin family serine protease
MSIAARFTLAGLLLVALVAPPRAQSQEDQQYVLTASSWGAAQTEAVTDAGGVVSFSHEGSGLALVRSAAPDFLTRVRDSGVIASAELDRVVQWTSDPLGDYSVEAEFMNPPNDDTFFNGIQWAPQAIDAPAAWALGCTGAGVRVAILDGGIHSTHIDLAANLDVARSRSFTTGDFNTDVGTFWHGTHVAGIIAAADNGIGTIGIAPRATIIGVKVLHGGSGSFGNVILGILYAATPIAEGGAGADIINLSLGAVFPKNAEGGGLLLALMNKAANFANQNGVLVISGAGNGGLDLQHSGNLVAVPAESGSAVSVAATGPLGFALGQTNFDRPASYSNYGNSAIDISAPGGDFVLPGTANCALPATPAGFVVAPCWVFDMVISSARGSGASNTTYAFAAGTSAAAPAAAAVAALIKQKHPDFSRGALRTALENSAISAGDNVFHGKGWVNALSACQY